MVLDGDQPAGQHLRRDLSFLATLPTIEGPTPAGSRNARVSERFDLFPLLPSEGRFPITDPRGLSTRRAFPVDRLLPILTATFRIATDAEDGRACSPGWMRVLVESGGSNRSTVSLAG